MKRALTQIQSGTSLWGGGGRWKPSWPLQHFTTVVLSVHLGFTLLRPPPASTANTTVEQEYFGQMEDLNI